MTDSAAVKVARVPGCSVLLSRLSATSDKSRLRSHKSHHVKSSKKPQHECETCGKKFAERHKLTRHRRMHSPSKQYACHKCGHTFSRREHLARHSSVHSRERPFECRQCGETFKRAQNLKRHFLVHASRDRPHACRECGETFARRDHLVRHSRVHSNPFSCEHCSEWFPHKNDLLGHIRLRHSSDAEDPDATSSESAEPQDPVEEVDQAMCSPGNSGEPVDVENLTQQSHSEFMEPADMVDHNRNSSDNPAEDVGVEGGSTVPCSRTSSPDMVDQDQDQTITDDETELGPGEGTGQTPCSPSGPANCADTINQEQDQTISDETELLADEGTGQTPCGPTGSVDMAHPDQDTTISANDTELGPDEDTGQTPCGPTGSVDMANQEQDETISDSDTELGPDDGADQTQCSPSVTSLPAQSGDASTTKYGRSVLTEPRDLAAGDQSESAGVKDPAKEPIDIVGRSQTLGISSDSEEVMVDVDSGEIPRRWDNSAEPKEPGDTIESVDPDQFFSNPDTTVGPVESSMDTDQVRPRHTAEHPDAVGPCQTGPVIPADSNHVRCGSGHPARRMDAIDPGQSRSGSSNIQANLDDPGQTSDSPDGSPETVAATAPEKVPYDVSQDQIPLVSNDTYKPAGNVDPDRIPGVSTGSEIPTATAEVHQIPSAGSDPDTVNVGQTPHGPSSLAEPVDLGELPESFTDLLRQADMTDVDQILRGSSHVAPPPPPPPEQFQYNDSDSNEQFVDVE